MRTMPLGWYLNRVAANDERRARGPGVWLTIAIAHLWMIGLMVSLILRLHVAWRWLALLVIALSLFNIAVMSWRFRAARTRRRRTAS